MDVSATLSREKSVINRVSDAPKPVPLLELRSNRMVVTAKWKDRSQSAVIRGQSVPASLRLASLLLDSLEDDPFLFSEENTKPFDWETKWLARRSTYERRYRSTNWVALFVDNKEVYNSHPSPLVSMMEQLSVGTDFKSSEIQATVAELVGEAYTSAEDLTTQHDTQTALVMTPSKEFLRVAVLDRRENKTGSFAVSAYHPPKPFPQVTASSFLNFCADITEAVQLRNFHERVKANLASGRITMSQELSGQVFAAATRKKNVLQFITAFEEATKLLWRPDRPDLY